MSHPVFDSENLTDEEKSLLREHVVLGSDISTIPKIPAAPDISPAPVRKKGVPGTFKNRIEGLVALKSDELPVVGRHFVVWGSHYFSDIKARPVVKSALESEDSYTEQQLDGVRLLLDQGLKNPEVWTDPETGRPELPPIPPTAEKWDRLDRAERYARWRYKGFVCGEVASL